MSNATFSRALSAYSEARSYSEERLRRHLYHFPQSVIPHIVSLLPGYPSSRDSTPSIQLAMTSQ
jgi:hypothetical protein